MNTSERKIRRCKDKIRMAHGGGNVEIARRLALEHEQIILRYNDTGNKKANIEHVLHELEQHMRSNDADRGILVLCHFMQRAYKTLSPVTYEKVMLKYSELKLQQSVHDDSFDEFMQENEEQVKQRSSANDDEAIATRVFSQLGLAKDEKIGSLGSQVLDTLTNLSVDKSNG